MPEAISLMTNGSFLVNTARGGHGGCRRQFRKRFAASKLAGAAIDVLPEESRRRRIIRC